MFSKNFRLIIALINCQLCLFQSIEEIDIERTLSKTSKPNILLILADDLGFGDIEGLFSHPTSITPNINALASQSKVFTNFYVASPVCSPSRYYLYFDQFDSWLYVFISITTKQENTLHQNIQIYFIELLYWLESIHNRPEYTQVYSGRTVLVVFQLRSIQLLARN